MSNTIHPSASGFLHPKRLFIAGLVILVAGVSFNHFYGLKGVIELETGRISSMKTGNVSGAASDPSVGDLGLNVSLDSVWMNSFTPVYEIYLSKKDTIKTHANYQTGAAYSVVSNYPLEQMKINVMEKTDLRFRLKEFYPNFHFAYQYPADRDTIAPKAPGITLELKTKEGSPIVTLRSDQPNKHLLGDIVSLGASLAFYWTIPMDSIKEMAANTIGNKIVFSGADTTVYFLVKDSIKAQPLKENILYDVPGMDSTGFTILFCYPDIAYLKAVPSSKGTELVNPVAHVEIWNEGGSAKDAFLYPESSNRKGGDFDIPDSDYRLGLSLSKEQAQRNCNCSISVQKDSTTVAHTLTFLSGKSAMYHGYSFSPVACRDTLPKAVTMAIAYFPGRILVILGYILTGLAFIVYLFKRFQANNGRAT